MHERIRSLCTTALFTTLLIVGAWLVIPITSPPYTMQSFVLFCAFWLLPFKQSSTAVILYLLMGAIGLPVFAGFEGGFGVFLEPTKGYLFGFLLMPLFMLGDKKRGTWGRVIRCALSMTVCYACGALWYIVGYSGFTWGGVLAAMVQCVLPFIIPDAIKLAAAVLVCKRMEPLLTRL